MREKYFQWPDGGTVNQQYSDKFKTFVNDDLNTSQAIALISELIKATDIKDADKKATINLFDTVLGLRLSEWQPAAKADVPEEIETLVQARAQARADKDWAAADKARDDLAAQGYEVIDTPDGPEVKTL